MVRSFVLSFVVILSLTVGVLCEAANDPVVIRYEPLDLADEQEYEYEPTVPHIRRKRAVTALKERLWDNGVIPYVINENITDVVRANIMDAIQHWEINTCIRFAEWTTEPDHIEFAPGPCGCCSFVGRQGKGRQYVNLTPYCAVYGVAVHEIGHSVGFWHEHSRPDRDKYVLILDDNIKADRKENFKVKPAMDIDSLGQPYDYNSIMHYRRTTFSRNDKDTMVPLKENVIIGQREALSAGDILQANLLYNCPKPHCDAVFTGPSGNFTSPNHPLHYYKDHNCTFVIQAPDDAYVEIRLEPFHVEPTENCTFDFVEFRQGGAQGPLVGRLCGMGETGRLRIKGSVWIQFVSDVSVTMSGFIGYYHIVDGLEDNQIQYDEFNADTDNSTDVPYPNESQNSGLFTYTTDCKKLMTNEVGRVASPLNLVMSSTQLECRWTITGDPGMKIRQIQIMLDKTITGFHKIKCMGDVYTRKKSSKANRDDMSGYEEYVYDCRTLTMSAFTLKTDTIVIVWSSQHHPGFALDYRIGQCSLCSKMLNCRFPCLEVYDGYADYDECSTNVSKCEQICINKIRGYECRCRPGYLLEDNGFTCRPKLAQFTDLCNSKLTSSRGVITANASPSPLDCYFHIEQPVGHRIHIVFSEINIPESVNCTVDYVQVRKSIAEVDGGTYLCGTEIPPPISTSSGYLTLALHVTSQVTPVPNPYFVAHFVVHPNPDGDRCFFRLRNEGNFSSPNFPNKYPSPSVCTYKLSVPPPYKIRLQFHAMDIEVTKRCMFDHVVVRNGRNRAMPLIGRYCGKTVPDDIISQGRQLWIMFIADGSHNGRGFSASFSAVRADGTPVTLPTPETTLPPTTLAPSTVRPRRRKRRRRTSNRTTLPTQSSRTTTDSND